MPLQHTLDVFGGVVRKCDSEPYRDHPAVGQRTTLPAHAIRSATHPTTHPT